MFGANVTLGDAVGIVILVVIALGAPLSESEHPMTSAETKDLPLNPSTLDRIEANTAHQEVCPGCDHGLLYAPARFHSRCGGSGYIIVEGPALPGSEERKKDERQSR